MNINVCMHIYGCICVGLSVCLWIGDQRGDLIPGIFEGVPKCLEDLPLAILVGSPHKELCQWKPVRLEERMKDVSVRSETFRAQDVGLGSQAQHRTWSRKSAALRHGSQTVGRWYGVRKKGSEQLIQWQDESASLEAVLDFCRILTIAIHTHKEVKKCQLHLLKFLLLFYYFFVYNLWNAQSAECEN